MPLRWKSDTLPSSICPNAGIVAARAQWRGGVGAVTWSGFLLSSLNHVILKQNGKIVFGKLVSGPVKGFGNEKNNKLFKYGQTSRFVSFQTNTI
jgi:hypothetical protein